MCRRSNQDWLDELCGERGRENQRRAHEDPANYLYVVAYNYLRMRQSDHPILSGFADQELAALAQDLVQETIEKLARDGYALLAQFRGEGSFTSWAAQIVRRQSAQEIRRPHWKRRVPLRQETDTNEGNLSAAIQFHAALHEKGPEDIALANYVAGVLQACIDRLPERRRQAFWGCIVQDRDAQSVAEVMDTTRNAVYLLVRHAKRQLIECLQQSGVTKDILN